MVDFPIFYPLIQPSYPPWLLPIGDGDSDVDSEEKAWRKDGGRRDGGRMFWDVGFNHEKNEKN